MSDGADRGHLEQNGIAQGASAEDRNHVPDCKSHFWGLPSHFFWDSIGFYRVNHFPKAVRRKSQKEKTPDEIVAQFTIVLAVISFFGTVVNILSLAVIKGQLGEMQSSSAQTDKIIAADTDLARAAKAQAAASDALTEANRTSTIISQRAWIGPINASMEPLVEGKPVKVIYTYQNSGREPALQRNVSLMTFFDKNQWGSFAQGGSIQFSERYKNLCKSNDVIGGQVVYPTSGFSSYTSSAQSDKEGTPAFVADADLIGGDKTVTIFGCMTYEAGGKTRHSSFCFYYNSKITPNPANMNICEAGGFAD